MPDIILENKTINEPVADAAARAAIPTASLDIGTIVYQIDEKYFYSWNGTEWEKTSVSMPTIGLGADYDTLRAAITAGERMVEQIGNTTESGDITLPANVFVYNRGNFSIAMGEFTIDNNGFNLCGSSELLWITCGFSSVKSLFNGSGGVYANRLLIDSSSTSNDAFICGNTGPGFYCESITYNPTLSPVSGQLLSLNYDSRVGTIDIGNSSSPTNLDDVLQVNATSLVDRVYIYPEGSKTSTMISVTGNGVINKIIYKDPNGAAPYAQKISLSGTINSIDKETGFTGDCNINVSLDADGAILNNAVLGDGVVTNNEKINHMISNVTASSIVDISKTGGSCLIAHSTFSSSFTTQTSNNIFTIVTFGGTPTFLGANTKIVFCDFSGTFVTDTLSAGKIIGSNAVSAPTLNGTYKRDGNDSTIGNDISGTGDVVGPASATDNALARYDGTTGKLIKDGIPWSSTAPTTNQFPKWNGTEYAPSNEDSNAFQIISATGNGQFTAPANAIFAEISAYGSGGGGASAGPTIDEQADGYSGAGGGGGGSGETDSISIAVSAGMIFNYSIAAGGSAGAAGFTPSAGGDGGQTSVAMKDAASDLIVANGGLGGVAPTSAGGGVDYSNGGEGGSGYAGGGGGSRGSYQNNGVTIYGSNGGGGLGTVSGGTGAQNDTGGSGGYNFNNGGTDPMQGGPGGGGGGQHGGSGGVVSTGGDGQYGCGGGGGSGKVWFVGLPVEGYAGGAGGDGYITIMWRFS